MSELGWGWSGSRLLRVLDGDTLEVALARDAVLDVGFGIKITQRVEVERQRLRLRRIDAAGIGTARGQAAFRRVEELLRHESDPNDLLVITYKPYKYGGRLNAAEYMGEVTLGDGRWLTDVLLNEGLVDPYDGQGPRPN